MKLKISLSSIARYRLATTLAFVFTLFTTGLFSGCRVHTGELRLPDNPKTICVSIVDNKTYEYGAEERLTDILIQEILRDGRLKVVPRSKADLELQTTLMRYDLEKVTINRDEQAVVFNLDTAIEATLIDLRTGKVLFDQEPFREKGVFFLSNQPQTRREELIYGRMAEDVISRLFEGW